MEAVGKPLLPCGDGASPSLGTGRVTVQCATTGYRRHIGFALNRKSKNHKF